MNKEKELIGALQYAAGQIDTDILTSARYDQLRIEGERKKVCLGWLCEQYDIGELKGLSTYHAREKEHNKLKSLYEQERTNVSVHEGSFYFTLTKEQESVVHEIIQNAYKLAGQITDGQLKLSSQAHKQWVWNQYEMGYGKGLEYNFLVWDNKYQELTNNAQKAHDALVQFESQSKKYYVKLAMKIGENNIPDALSPFGVLSYAEIMKAMYDAKLPSSTIIRKRMGWSWKSALEKAGLDPIIKS